MGPAPTRRDFLALALGGAAVPLLASPLRAAGLLPPSSQTSTSIEAIPLGTNLLLFTGAGGNVVVASAPDAVVMVNGGHEESSADLLESVAEHTGGKRVAALFNTDWHREHTGSNAAIAKAGGTIIAHEHTKQYLGAEIYVDWQSRTYKPLPAAALPTETFYSRGTLKVGSEPIEYGHLGQAHTDAAIYVHFPGADVLVAGDALSVGEYPIPDYTTGGWLGGFVAANKTLLGLATPDTRVIPTTGPIQTRADLQAQHDMLAAMMERFVKLMKQGRGPEDIIAGEITKDFDAKWGNPDLFVKTSYRSLWLHVRELGGIV